MDKPNTSLSSPTVEELIGKLDPNREYGLPGGDKPLEFEEVVAGVRSGRFTIHEGDNLPVLRERDSNWPLRGSGFIIRQNGGPQQSALAEFRRRALDDIPTAYKSLMDGMKRGDPRYDKIFWDNLVGKVGENREQAMSGVLQRLIDMSERLATGQQQPRVERTIEVDSD